MYTPYRTFHRAQGVLRFIGLVTFISLLVLSTGCSSTGSGAKGLGEGSGGLSEADLNAERDRRFGGAGIPLAENGQGVFHSVNFDYDSVAISSMARQEVEFNADVLRKNPDVRVTLEGHCDERGTAEYNMALGEKRARAVKDLLVSLGISSSRLETVSYGSEVPLDTAHDEAAWAKNRRVNFSAYRDLPNR